MRVIDYKSGSLDLSLHEVYHGLKLQLALYLEAAREAYQNVKTAGLFYYRVHDPILTARTMPEAIDEAWRRAKLAKSQGLKGYVLKDREVMRMIDRDFESSLFLPIHALKSGEFSKGSKLLTEEGFRLLGGHSRKVLNRAGQRIMAGDISLTPYQSKGKSACTYCPYRSVCRFDTTVPGHGYRWLQAMPDDVVQEKMKADYNGGI
jgi:ATP-dependent helicase/nuclease subunit B